MWFTERSVKFSKVLAKPDTWRYGEGIIYSSLRQFKVDRFVY